MRDPLEEAGVDVNSSTATGVLVAVLAGLVALAVFVPGSRTALALVAGIILLIMLHEFGHYWTAKRSGMKVTEFFLGFGPRLWSFTRGETEYGVKALPLGGYVRIIGMTNMEDVDPEDEPRTYRQQTTGKRLMVILAGVTVNLFIAFLLFFVIIAGQGRVPDGVTTTVAGLDTDTPAYAAGVQPGDRIVAIDGKRLGSWDEFKAYVAPRMDETVTLLVVRDGQIVELTPTLGENPKKRGVGFLGVEPTIAYEEVGVLAAVPKAIETMGDVTTNTWNGLTNRFTPEGVQTTAEQSFTSAAPVKGSVADQSRPMSLIGLVDQGSDIADGNIWAILWLLAALSLVLALFNLLPVLPLDGGHAVVAVYEGIASKVKHHRVFVDYRKLIPISAVVLIPLMFIALSAMVLDIRQLGN